jgi:hypothetical protein
MHDWLMIGFVVLVVVGVSVYRHYKGDEESCSCCGDGGTTDYDDEDDTINIRPEVIEMCKEKYWEYDGNMLFAPNHVFKVIFLGSKWYTNSELNRFLTNEERDYLANIVGERAKQIEFEELAEYLEVAKDVKTD